MVLHSFSVFSPLFGQFVRVAPFVVAISFSNVLTGSFDSSVHISEEASNAAVAVPWAIVWAIGIAGVLGWGEPWLCRCSCQVLTRVKPLMCP